MSRSRRRSILTNMGLDPMTHRLVCKDELLVGKDMFIDNTPFSITSVDWREGGLFMGGVNAFLVIAHVVRKPSSTTMVSTKHLVLVDITTDEISQLKGKFSYVSNSEAVTMWQDNKIKASFRARKINRRRWNDFSKAMAK